jgi:hypothetical protein
MLNRYGYETFRLYENPDNLISYMSRKVFKEQLEIGEFGICIYCDVDDARAFSKYLDILGIPHHDLVNGLGLRNITDVCIELYAKKIRYEVQRYIVQNSGKYNSIFIVPTVTPYLIKNYRIFNSFGCVPASKVNSSYKRRIEQMNRKIRMNLFHSFGSILHKLPRGDIRQDGYPETFVVSGLLNGKIGYPWDVGQDERYKWYIVSYGGDNRRLHFKEHKSFDYEDTFIFFFEKFRLPYEITEMIFMYCYSQKKSKTPNLEVGSTLVYNSKLRAIEYPENWTANNLAPRVYAQRVSYGVSLKQYGDDYMEIDDPDYV